MMFTLQWSIAPSEQNVKSYVARVAISGDETNLTPGWWFGHHLTRVGGLFGLMSPAVQPAARRRPVLGGSAPPGLT
jgi:hypothetical protein